MNNIFWRKCNIWSIRKVYSFNIVHVNDVKIAIDDNKVVCVLKVLFPGKSL